MISTVSLIFKIFKNPWKPILPPEQQTIYSFDRNDQRNRLFSKFLSKPITFESLTNVSWTDIFSEKFVLLQYREKHRQNRHQNG